MSRYDTAIGIFLLVFSVILSIGAIRLGIGKLNDFGPGFFPLLVGLLIATFSLIIILSSTKDLRNRESRKSQSNALITGKAAMIVVTLLFFGLFVEKAGFFVCTFFITILLLRVNGIRKWSHLLLPAILTCIGIFFLFNVLLEVRLPLGILRF